MRARPSLIQALNLPCIFATVAKFNESLLPESVHKSMLAGMEKGLQNEADEALRIMNERGLTKEKSEDIAQLRD